MNGADAFLAVALIAFVAHAMLRRTFGHGLVWWAIAGLILVYAAGRVVVRCARSGGWGWMRDLFEAELAVTRASFLALPAAAAPRPRAAVGV